MTTCSHHIHTLGQNHLVFKHWVPFSIHPLGRHWQRLYSADLAWGLVEEGPIRQLLNAKVPFKPSHFKTLLLEQLVCSFNLTEKELSVEYWAQRHNHSFASIILDVRQRKGSGYVHLLTFPLTEMSVSTSVVTLIWLLATVKCRQSIDHFWRILEKRNHLWVYLMTSSLHQLGWLSVLHVGKHWMEGSWLFVPSLLADISSWVSPGLPSNCCTWQ